MKKISIALVTLCSWAFGASAQMITQQEANSIAKQYVQNQIGQSAELYINENAPNDDGISITTSNEETFRHTTPVGHIAYMNRSNAAICL